MLVAPGKLHSAFDITGTGMMEQAVEDGGGQHPIAEHFTSGSGEYRPAPRFS
jgi:hypothetical protein